MAKKKHLGFLLDWLLSLSISMSYNLMHTHLFSAIYKGPHWVGDFNSWLGEKSCRHTTSSQRVALRQGHL